jgi:hypothetical protein
MELMRPKLDNGIMPLQRVKPLVLGTVLLVTFAFLSIARGEDALDPRTYGDWNHENAPVPTYRQNCHPAMSICQLPIRPITKSESDMNQRSASGKRLGTPSPPIISQEPHPFGPEIGKKSSLDSLTVRSGPGIKR